MFGLGMQELVIVFLIVFVLFGATKLPQIGKGMGEAIRNFKKETSKVDKIDANPQNPVSEDKSG